jgi:hypothetical protein
LNGSAFQGAVVPVESSFICADGIPDDAGTKLVHIGDATKRADHALESVFYQIGFESVDQMNEVRQNGTAMPGLEILSVPA